MIDQDLYRKEYLVTVCTNTGMVYKYYVFTNKRANAKRHVYNHISRETNIMEGVDRLDITVKPYNGGAPGVSAKTDLVQQIDLKNYKHLL